MLKRASLFIYVLISVLGFSILKNAFIPSDSEKSLFYKNKKNSCDLALADNIKDRFFCPKNYKRVECKLHSFQEYLRSLKLKPKGTEVLYYDGSVKMNNGVYEAVVDLGIGDKNLHQCADAIMRLKAEYLWRQEAFDEIHFNLTNGFRVNYSEWIKGNRIVVEGNKTSWAKLKPPSNTYQDFWNYMELIFMYAGTASLERELQKVSMHTMQIGDVFIKGGYPGHAAIVVDMAENKLTGDKLFILAQSYMPAQELHILKNPNNDLLSPWYNLKEGSIITPEWTFESDQLMRFK